LKKNAHVVGGLMFGLYANEMIVPHVPLFQSIHADLLVSVTLLTGSLFGSLLPDIDHQGSYLGRRLKPISFLVSKTAGHRGATHSLLVNLVLSVLTACIVHSFSSGLSQLFLLVFITGCLIGAISHLFLDSLTVSGIPLLYPLSSKKFRLLTLKTGGIGEKIIIVIMIIAIIFLVKNILHPWLNL
jgi:inner membrane protein